MRSIPANKDELLFILHGKLHGCSFTAQFRCYVSSARKKMLRWRKQFSNYSKTFFLFHQFDGCRNMPVAKSGILRTAGSSSTTNALLDTSLVEREKNRAGRRSVVFWKARQRRNEKTRWKAKQTWTRKKKENRGWEKGRRRWDLKVYRSFRTGTCQEPVYRKTNRPTRENVSPFCSCTKHSVRI